LHHFTHTSRFLKSALPCYTLSVVANIRDKETTRWLP
jgi:hypothetical protein